MEVRLPISKSVASRELLLDHVLYRSATARYEQYKATFSESLPVDIQVLGAALKRLEQRQPEEEVELDCHESGTALRFLLALSAVGERPVTLQMSDRLAERPIKGLVEVYESLGATFRKEQQQLRITPITRRAFSQPIEAKAWPSSQFSSAIHLTAPLLQWQSLELIVPSYAPSFSYFCLTLQQLHQRGIDVQQSGDSYTIQSIHPQPSPNLCEADWTAAAYFYQLLALRPSIRQIELPYLSLTSPQPDAVLPSIYSQLGVHTEPGVTITPSERKCEEAFRLDLSQNPDLFPSIALTAIGLGVPCTITGLQTLSLKESDRITAVLEGLKAIGYGGLTATESLFSWDGTRPTQLIQNASIHCHNDHRIAMAFGVLNAALQLELQLSHPTSVSKSFPDFWQQLEQVIGSYPVNN